jgi:carboxyl-terminal processing protease
MSEGLEAGSVRTACRKSKNRVFRPPGGESGTFSGRISAGMWPGWIARRTAGIHDPAMTRWLVVAAISLAGPAAFAAHEPELPTAEFKALPLSERNLAVYDAFWKNIENSHYDRALLTRTDVRVLREQGRKKAAVAGDPADLYTQVLIDIARQLPESYVEVEPPRIPEQSSYDETPAWARIKSREHEKQAAMLLLGGSGFDETTIRRGSKKVRVVTEVSKDSPAAEFGISPGWRVLSFDSDFDVLRNTVRFSGAFVPMEAAPALALEQGKLPDTSPAPANVVKINYAHRGLAARAPFESRRVAKGVQYVRFDGFGDDQFMGPVYDALHQAGPDGLIIDLRWNAGGNTEQARKVAGVLLGDGVTIGYQTDGGGAAPIRTTKAARRYEGSLVVLVGPASGGASEILAAAIKEHGRGKLVGRMTNGSVLNSRTFALPDGGFMSVPTGDIRTSTRRPLEGVGVRPDYRVLPTLEDVRAGRDPTLARAVSVIIGEPPAPRRIRPGEFFPPI